MNIRKRVYLDGTYVLSPCAVINDDADGEVTVLHAKRGYYWRGNASALVVLNLLRCPTTPLMVVDKFVKQYDVPQRRAEEDVLALFKDLYDAGLIQKVGNI